MERSNIVDIWFHPFLWKYKDEASFTTSFNKSIDDLWWFIFKISDFSPESKPFDCTCMFQWNPYAIEIKYTKNKRDFTPYKLLRWSSVSNPWGQVRWLDLFEKNGWISLVIVYSVVKQGYYVYRFRDLWVDFKQIL